MKVLFIIFSLFLLSTGEAANLRKLEEEEPLPGSADKAPLPETPESLLESPECTEFMEIVGESVKKLIDYGEYAVTNYICNPVERAAIKETVAKAETDVEIAEEEGGKRRLQEEKGRCVVALEKLVLESKTKTLEAMRSGSACKKEIRKELAEIGDEADRHLFFSSIIGFVKQIPALFTSVADPSYLTTLPFTGLRRLEEGLNTHRKLEEYKPMPGSEEEPSALSNAEAMLSSDKCVDFMAHIEKSMKELMDFGDYALANYLCNPIERQNIKEEVKKVEEDIAKAEVLKRQLQDEGAETMEIMENPCKPAYERVILEQKTESLKAMRSTASCKKEVKKEISQVKEAENRHLLSGHFEQPIWSCPTCTVIPPPVFSWASLVRALKFW